MVPGPPEAEPTNAPLLPKASSRTTRRLTTFYVPLAGVNAVLVGLLSAYMNAKFDNVNQRFDDMRSLWPAEPTSIRGSAGRAAEAH